MKADAPEIVEVFTELKKIWVIVEIFEFFWVSLSSFLPHSGLYSLPQADPGQVLEKEQRSEHLESQTYFEEKFLIFKKFKQNPYLFKLLEDPLKSVSTFWY